MNKSFLEADTRIWNDISTDLRRGMWKMIKNLGKTTEADKKYFESCAQRVQEATGKNNRNKKQQKEKQMTNTKSTEAVNRVPNERLEDLIHEVMVGKMNEPVVN